jgi:hypothetical protein
MNRKYIIVILMVVILGALFYFLVLATIDSVIINKANKTVSPTPGQEANMSGREAEVRATFKNDYKKYDVFKPERRVEETKSIDTNTEDLLM